jgi:peptidoglycan/xylan/chitin deacetylase (PgdA/CDA1 family)
MRYLAERGFSLQTLSSFCDAARSTGEWPRKSFALTFDDGYSDCRSFAFPILRKYGFTATVFVITDTIECEKAGPLFCHPKKTFLTKSDLRFLIDEGWEVGSHTCTHARLPALSSTERTDQIVLSKTILEENLKTPIRSFSYPGGCVNAATLDSVLNAGYDYAVITPWAAGLIHHRDWLTLERVGLYPQDGFAKLRVKLSPAFHWIRRASFAFHARAIPSGAAGNPAQISPS